MQHARWWRRPEFRGSHDDGIATRNFAFGEDSLALRLGSELPDRRAANADRDPASCACGVPTDVGSNSFKRKDTALRVVSFLLEAPPGIGPGIKVLQTSALPLGYGAVSAGISVPYSPPPVKYFLLYHFQEFFFPDDLHAQAFRLCELAARVLPRHYQSGFL